MELEEQDKNNEEKEEEVTKQTDFVITEAIELEAKKELTIAIETRTDLKRMGENMDHLVNCYEELKKVIYEQDASIDSIDKSTADALQNTNEAVISLKKANVEQERGSAMAKCLLFFTVLTILIVLAVVIIAVFDPFTP